MSWLTICLTFIAVNLDFFFILICLLHKYKLQSVILGYLAGILILVSASFLTGKLLDTLLPEWLLGFLGILPIWMALHDNDESPDKHKSVNHAWLTVLITYMSVCTGCNLSIFLPVLTSVSPFQFMQMLLLLTILTVLLVCLLKVVGDLPVVDHLMKQHGDRLTKIIYVSVGIYVFFDSGLIKHLIMLI